MLPFHITKLWGLKSKTHGFALVNEGGIQLVFRDAADIKKKPEEHADSLTIAWDNLAQLEVQRGFLADAVIIKVHAMVGEDPDGNCDNAIELELQKRDRPQLERFEKHVNEYRSGQRKDNVDDVLDDVRDFLDRI